MSKIYLRPENIAVAQIHKPGTLYGPHYTVKVNITGGGHVFLYRNDMESCEALMTQLGLTAVAENPSGEPEKPYKATFDEVSKTLNIEIHDDIRVEVSNQTKAFITVNPPNAGDTITVPSVSVERSGKYKFKKGDRVRNIQPDSENSCTDSYQFGSCGAVDEDNSLCPYVRWDNGKRSAQSDEHLELIK